MHEKRPLIGRNERKVRWDYNRYKPFLKIGQIQKHKIFHIKKRAELPLILQTPQGIL